MSVSSRSESLAVDDGIENYSINRTASSDQEVTKIYGLASIGGSLDSRNGWRISDILITESTNPDGIASATVVPLSPTPLPLSEDEVGLLKRIMAGEFSRIAQKEKQLKGNLIEKIRPCLKHAVETSSLGEMQNLVKLYPACIALQIEFDGENIPLLLYACRVSKLHVVKYLLDKMDDLVKKKTFGQIQVLRALGFNDKDGELDDVKDIKFMNDSNQMNALHYACCGNNLEVVKYLVEQREFNIHLKDKCGQLPIYHACIRSTMDIKVVEYLLQQGSSIESISKHGDGIINLLSEYFCQDHDELGEENLQLLIILSYSCIYHRILGRKDCYKITFQNILKSNNLPLVAIAYTRYLEHLEYPFTVLHNEWHCSSDEKPPCHELFHNYLLHEGVLQRALILPYLRDADNTHQYMVLFYLTQCMNGIQRAIKNHYIEADELEITILRKFRGIIAEIFLSGTLFDRKLLRYLLLPFQRMHYEKLQRDYAPKDWHVLYYEDSVVRYCLEHNIAPLFNTAQIKHLMQQIFYGVARAEEFSPTVLQYYHYTIYSYSLAFLYNGTISEGSNDSDLEVAGRNFFQVVKYSHALSSNPALMMFIQFISRLVLLGLVGYVAIYEYGSNFQLNYSMDSAQGKEFQYKRDISNTEIALLYFAGAEFIYQLGKWIEEKKQWCDIINFFERNILDALRVWIILRLHSVEYFPVARVLLAIIAIPLTIELLYFASVFQPFGELLFLIPAMFSSIISFTVIYFFILVGFGIFFYSLFYKVNDNFSTPGWTLVTLFQNTLHNLTFYEFSTNSEEVNTLGVVMLLLFLSSTAIVLMNLFIAHLSLSMNNMKAVAKERWSLEFAKLTRKYLSFHEQTIFCMFPAPFNIIAITCAPLYYLVAIVWGISIGSIVSNFLCSYLFGTWLRFYHNIHHFSGMIYYRLPQTLAEMKGNMVWKMLFVIIYIFSAVFLIGLDLIFLPCYTLICELMLVKSEIASHNTQSSPTYRPVMETQTVTNEAIVDHNIPEMRPMVYSLYIQFIAKEELAIYTFIPKCLKYLDKLRKFLCVGLFANTAGHPKVDSLLAIKIPEFHLKLLKVLQSSSPNSLLRSRAFVGRSRKFSKETIDSTASSSVFENALLFTMSDVERILRPLKSSWTKKLSQDEEITSEIDNAQQAFKLRNILEISENRMNCLENKFDALNENIVKLLSALDNNG